MLISALATLEMRYRGISAFLLNYLVQIRKKKIVSIQNSVRHSDRYYPLRSSEKFVFYRDVAEITSGMQTEKKELLANMLKRWQNSDIFTSFEIMPPDSENELPDLWGRLSRLHELLDPLFYSITWHLRSAPKSCNDLCPPAYQTAKQISQEKKTVLLHVAARGLSKHDVSHALSKAQDLNVNNIFALRGDYFGNSNEFPHALHLVKFIRLLHREKMTICVAGYPQGHPEAQSYAEDLFCLKDKVDAGADFIITQIELETENFIKFVRDCRRIGITVPILAGIMPIQDYNSLKRISKLCRFQIPKNIHDILEPIKAMNESIKNFGIFHAVEMAKRILLSKSTSGLHFFTLNRIPEIVEICEQIGLTTPKLVRTIKFHSDFKEKQKNEYQHSNNN